MGLQPLDQMVARRSPRPPGLAAQQSLLPCALPYSLELPSLVGEHLG